MREKFYKAEIYKVDYTKFGGKIYPSDFDTSYNSGNIASRIVHDWTFDKQCKKNIESRSRNIKKRQEESCNG